MDHSLKVILDFFLLIGRESQTGQMSQFVDQLVVYFHGTKITADSWIPDNRFWLNRGQGFQESG
jgi:hypothetical protein